MNKFKITEKCTHCNRFRIDESDSKCWWEISYHSRKGFVMECGDGDNNSEVTYGLSYSEVLSKLKGIEGVDKYVIDEITNHFWTTATERLR